MRRKCHKLWGILIVTLLHAILLAGVFCCKKTEEAPVSEYLDSFGIEVTTKEKDFSYTIKWWTKENAQENEYYLTIPGFAKDQKVKVDYIAGSDVYLNGEKLKSGMKITALAEGENTLTCAEKEYSLYVIYGSDIPVVHIKTDSGSMDSIYADKRYKESGYATILWENGIAYEGSLEYLTIRGNYTSTLVKKPFNIKFYEKKDLFDMGASKKWCLLANYLDNTMLKDKVGYEFADSVGLTYSPESILVDLYINDEYVGNYTLSERIEISEDRINIADMEEMNERLNQGIDFETLEIGGVRGDESYLELGSSKWVDLPNSSAPESGAYLIEYELASRYDDEISGFISNYGQPIIVKSPEYASEEQVSYIQNYYQEFEDAVLSEDGYNALGKHYSEYIDMESYAKLYVYQEFIKNLDAAGTSLFFYKEAGEKLVAGPVWDVDMGFGGSYEREGISMSDPESLWVTVGHLSNELSDKNSIFSLLCQHQDFRIEAKKQWMEYFEPNIDGLLENIDEKYKKNKESVVLDKYKWNFGGTYQETEKWMDQNIQTICDFISKRSDYLSKTYSDEKWESSNYLP